MESSIRQTHFKVVRYPYENPVDGMVGISDKGEVYVYVSDEWILMEDIEKWEEVYDANGKNIGRVKGNVFEDYRIGEEVLRDMGIYEIPEGKPIQILW